MAAIEAGKHIVLMNAELDGTVGTVLRRMADATGMTVARRGMYGPTVASGTPVGPAAKLFDADALIAGRGIADYVTGAAPGPGVFVLGHSEDPVQAHSFAL
jgi:predicted homoserine dehydrogenase-like protein